MQPSDANKRPRGSFAVSSRRGFLGQLGIAGLAAAAPPSAGSAEASPAELTEHYIPASAVPEPPGACIVYFGGDIAGFYRVKPSFIHITSSENLRGIRWSNWGRRTASGRGTAVFGRATKLPSSPVRLTVSNLRVGDSSVDLLVHRWRGTTSAEVLRKDGDLEVTIRV